MPCKTIERLKRSARKKFGTSTSDKAKAYVWGTYGKMKTAARKRRAR